MRYICPAGKALDASRIFIFSATKRKFMVAMWSLGKFLACFISGKLLENIGAGWRIRTPDPLITNQVLYQLS